MHPNQLSRRKFFMFLGAAAASPIIHHIIPEKMIFDMSMPVGIAPASIIETLNSVTMKHISSQSADEIFKPSPLFTALTAKKLEDAYHQAIFGYDEPDMIEVKDMATFRHLERMWHNGQVSRTSVKGR